MKFSYNWLQDYITKKLPKPEELAGLLTFHSFEVENVEKRDGDWVLDIDVLPNRAGDCLSHIGIAREIAVILNGKLKIKNEKLQSKIKNSGLKDFLKVEVENKNDCPRYTATTIREVRVKESPEWIRKRLEACGLQSINNVVDITNYVMLETGQPLHAFDFDKIQSKTSKKKIIVRRAKGGEKIEALDDKTYKLDNDVLVIADEAEPLAIAGIKGGKKAEIDNKTKNIVIEAANFDRLLIRRGSQKLKLKTDASWRFENNISPSLIDYAQKRVCSLIKELAGGEVVSGMIDTNPKRPVPKKIKLDLNYVEELLGLKIPKQKIISILTSLGFRVARSGNSALLVEVPEWRGDVSIPEDLIEEIGRIFGYDKIPSAFPAVSLLPAERNNNVFWSGICRDGLSQAGFLETYNYSFISEGQKEILGWPGEQLIELENPISLFAKYLRPSLIPNLLANVKYNLENFKKFRIFELGTVFKKIKNRGQKPKIEQKMMLAGVLVGPDEDNGFYELKGALDFLINKLGLSDVWYDDFIPSPDDSLSWLWHPKRSAEIKSSGLELGFIGEIHPTLLKDLKIKERVFAFDIDFEKLVVLASEEHEYRPISPYPSAVRDLAVLVPKGTKVVEIMNKINAAGSEIVRDIDLFDVYSGEGIPESKENFAFHIIYQSQDHTLTSGEVDRAHQKIVRALEKNPSWQVRR